MKAIKRKVMRHPRYHIKNDAAVRRMLDGYEAFMEEHDSELENMRLQFPHQHFDIVCEQDKTEDDDYEVEIHVEELSDDKWTAYWLADNAWLDRYKELYNEDYNPEVMDDWEAGLNLYVEQVATCFLLMLEYGIYNIKHRPPEGTSFNHEERRQKKLSIERWIEVRPHLHIKRAMAKGFRQSQKVRFAQLVRSHTRRLRPDFVVRVREHRRYADLPVRPSDYNASRMAKKSKPCEVCITSL